MDGALRRNRQTRRLWAQSSFPARNTSPHHLLLEELAMTPIEVSRRPSSLLRFALTITTAAVVASVSPAAAQTTADEEVTYTKDIAPILQRSCQNCHRTESVAPMSLLTYEDTRPWARAIKYRTNRVGKPNVMPPWYIERDIGIQQYKGDISLSEEEIGKIATWADNGAPRGDPADLPATVATKDESGWEIGEPDLVLRSPEVEVAATTPDWWGPMGEAPTGLTEDRYVSAVEMREVNTIEGPLDRDTIGGLYVIHHLVVVPVGDDGRPVAEAGFWPVHEVGRNADVFHPDSGRLLKAGSKLLFPSAHLHSNGRHTRASLEVGLKFHPKGYQPTGTTQIIGPATLDLDIRPMESDQKFEAFSTLMEHTKMTVFEPHMHAAGVRMCLDAIWNNNVETLSCSGYNHNWVRVYTYEDDAAPLLPKGTILRITGYFDNTPTNPNVSDPRNWSGLGHRSIDNMMINLGQAVSLSDAAFAAEIATRRERLRLTPGQTAPGCPLCGYSELPMFTTATDDGDADEGQ